MDYRDEALIVATDIENDVFPNTVGGQMITDNFVKRNFRHKVIEAGLPTNLRFHDASHTAATLLLKAGVNVKVVSEMLSHSDVSITLRVYALVLPSMQKEAAATMESILGNLF